LHYHLQYINSVHKKKKHFCWLLIGKMKFRKRMNHFFIGKSFLSFPSASSQHRRRLTATGNWFATILMCMNDIMVFIIPREFLL